MKYLKEEQHYIDQYDRFTVEDCRRFEKNILSNNKESKIFMTAVCRLIMYFHTGDKYSRKRETINNWMASDRDRDHKYENAHEPENIKCSCGRKIEIDHKTFHNDRVMFFFDCPLGCLPRKVFFENGEEWKPKPNPCPECSTELSRKSEHTEEALTTISSCSKCEYEDTDVHIFSNPQEDEVDPDYEKDRKRFCLSDEDGLKYIESKNSIAQIGKMMDERKEKEDKKDLYEEVEKLKKLSIPQVKEHVQESLKETPYINLEFEKPDMSRIVSVQFSIEDPAEEDGNESRKTLTKLITESLTQTNWRLMSDGINYRLGLLTGRIRVYEDEKDLVKLIEKKK